MHGSEFQLTDKKLFILAETCLIFCFVRYPRAVVGLLAGPPRAVVGLLAGPAGYSGPASGCFLKMEFLEELFNMALAMKGNELA
jgi:hypothetical protein